MPSAPFIPLSVRGLPDTARELGPCATPRMRKPLRSVGFQEPWLQQIHVGVKSETARLASNPDTCDLGAGDSFLACSSEREIPFIIEAVSTFSSFGRC